MRCIYADQQKFLYFFFIIIIIAALWQLAQKVSFVCSCWRTNNSSCSSSGNVAQSANSRVPCGSQRRNTDHKSCQRKGEVFASQNSFVSVYKSRLVFSITWCYPGLCSWCTLSFHLTDQEQVKVSLDVGSKVPNKLLNFVPSRREFLFFSQQHKYCEISTRILF